MAPTQVTVQLDGDTRARIEEVRPESESLEAWIHEAVSRRLTDEEAEPVEFVDDCAI